MNVLIVGGSSFIGKNLIQILPKDWNITATYNTSVDFESFVEHYDHVRAVRLDLNQPELPRFDKVDAVLYLVGVSPAMDNGEKMAGLSQTDFLHVKSVSRIMDCIEGFDQFVYFSSGIYYLLDNYSEYRKSRLMGEALVKIQAASRGFDYLIVRNMEIYGDYMPAHKIYRRICEWAMTNTPEINIAGDGHNLVDTMYIDDYVEIILKLLTLNIGNKTIDVCKSEPVTIRELIDAVYQVVDRPKPTINFHGTPTERTNFVLSNAEMIEVTEKTPKTDLLTGLKKWIDQGLK